VATRTVSREASTAVSVSLDLKPGNDYTVSAEVSDQSGTVIATGKSLPFSVIRQRVSTVDLTLAPLISLVAGTGANTYGGDGGPAASAQLFLPQGLAVDENGNLFIADTSNHAIRRVNSQGIITTLAGTTIRASTAPALGDNGLPTEVALRSPTSVAVAHNGDLLIADSQAIRIVPALNGDRYGQKLTGGRLHTLLVDSSLGGPIPSSVVVDRSGNIFYAESFRIQMVTPAGSRSVVAGVGATSKGAGPDGPAKESQLNVPEGMLLDPSGNLLFVERGNHRVRLLCRNSGTNFGIPMASGSVYTIAGKGVATTDPVTLGDGKDALEATLNAPRGLALDTQGNLYIADWGNQRIRRMSPDRRISTIAGTGSRSTSAATDLGDGAAALEATFANPTGLALMNDMLFIADTSNHRVRRVPL